MRLLTLRVEGFRNHLRPFEIEFRGGVNVLVGSNEAGKTGILLAIQTALFMPRFAADREGLVAEGAGVCTVGLDYELAGGSRFRIERDLINNRSSIRQWADAAWEPLATGAVEMAKIVRGHTGCDEQLFHTSLLVRHEQIEVADSGDITRALSERLEVLVSGSPAGVSATRAVTRLQQAISKLTGPRAGAIVAAAEALQEGRERLLAARQAATGIETGKPRLEELAGAVSALELEREETAAVVARARHLQDLEEKFAALRRNRLTIDRALDARTELQKLEDEALRARERVPLPVLPAVAEPERAWARPLLWGGLGVGLLALALLVWQPLPAAALLLAGLGAAAAGRLALRGPRRAAVAAASDGFAELELAARAAERRRDEAGGAARALDQRPDAELTAERAALGRNLQELEDQLAGEAIFRVDPVRLEKAIQRLQQLPALIAGAGRESIRLELQLDALAASAATMAELEDAAAIAEQEVDRLRFLAGALALAREELEAAIADIRLGVGPQIAAAAAQRLRAIVPGYGVRLEGESGLSFRPCWADGRPFERRDLSDGTADQFYFAVRAALAEVLLGGVNPPLLLDDPFRYCDADRRASLHRLLGEIGHDRQVLYFTIEEPRDLPVTHPLPLQRVSIR